MRSMPPRRPRQPCSTTRTSYHVGKPWMFEGKMLRAATGTPMRSTARANSAFADAEPEPFTFENLTTKSLTRAIGFIALVSRHDVRCALRAGRRLVRAAAIVGVRHVEQELLHVPGSRRAALG